MNWNMKRHIVIIALAMLTMSSCVTLGKYEALEASLNKQKKEHNVTRQELLDLKDELSTLQRQYQTQSTELNDLQALRLTLNDSLLLLKNQLGNMALGVDTLRESYAQQLEGQTHQLAKTQSQLEARTRELEIRNKELADKEQAMNEREKAFDKKYADLQAKEEAARKALQAKEKELETVRNAVANALVGFKDKGLNVEVRDSKVYVSLESKLMFASGSWAVSKEGEQAIKGLAKVLEENPELHIMVEGHTDNDAYKGSTAVKDNWDLSVMRATSIVKLLLKHGPKIAPARIEASGHSEYAPKVANDSPANKAMNRRTEIILTPDLDALLKSVQ